MRLLGLVMVATIFIWLLCIDMFVHGVKIVSPIPSRELSPRIYKELGLGYGEYSKVHSNVYLDWMQLDWPIVFYFNLKKNSSFDASLLNGMSSPYSDESPCMNTTTFSHDFSTPDSSVESPLIRELRELLKL